MWGKGNPGALLEMQTGAANKEESVELPQKIKNGTALLPSNPTSGKYLKKPETLIQKHICT